MSWNDDHKHERIRSWASTILIAAGLIAIAMFIVGGMSYCVYDGYLAMEHTELCYSNGYSEYRSGFCYKLVDGTEEMISIGNLK